MDLEIERVPEDESGSASLPLLSLNHLSFLCRSVAESVRFYEEVLGFVLIKRPASFEFEGAWLFNYGIGIHLLESNSAAVSPKKGVINPKDNHISFQCSDMQLVKRKLEAMNISYVTAVVEEGGVKVDQLFFHDPDGYMIEICNCDNLPVLPLSYCPRKKQPNPKDLPSVYANELSKVRCASQVEKLLMESLLTNMINISL